MPPCNYTDREITINGEVIQPQSLPVRPQYKDGVVYYQHNPPTSRKGNYPAIFSPKHWFNPTKRGVYVMVGDGALYAHSATYPDPIPEHTFTANTEQTYSFNSQTDEYVKFRPMYRNNTSNGVVSVEGKTYIHEATAKVTPGFGFVVSDVKLKYDKAGHEDYVHINQTLFVGQLIKLPLAAFNTLEIPDTMFSVGIKTPNNWYPLKGTSTDGVLNWDDVEWNPDAGGDLYVVFTEKREGVTVKLS